VDPVTLPVAVLQVPVAFRAIPSTGTTAIAKGDPLRVVSAQDDGLPIVERADADTDATMGTIGLAEGAAEATFDAPIRVVQQGLIRFLDTSAWSAGTKLYVGIGGGLTSPAPTYRAQHVATVILQDAFDGAVYVVGPNEAGGVATGPAALLYMGAASPEGAVTAPRSSLYLQDDGLTGTLWKKRAGVGNVGWAVVSTPGLVLQDENANFHVDTDANGRLYVCDTTAGAIAADLAAVPEFVGFSFGLHRVSGGANSLVFNPGFAHMVNGALSFSIPTQYSTAWFTYRDTGEWVVTYDGGVAGAASPDEAENILATQVFGG
jgi:hypothetical protein